MPLVKRTRTVHVETTKSDIVLDTYEYIEPDEVGKADRLLEPGTKEWERRISLQEHADYATRFPKEFAESFRERGGTVEGEATESEDEAAIRRAGEIVNMKAAEAVEAVKEIERVSELAYILQAEMDREGGARPIVMAALAEQGMT